MSDTQYTFAAKPMAVAASRKAGEGVAGGKVAGAAGGAAKGGYRGAEEGTESMNIMFDRRVYRGSTYSSHTRDKVAAQQEQAAKESAKKAAVARKKVGASSSGALTHAVAAPLPGRKDIEVQTDTYLEELTDKVPETEMETQTDAFNDRPALPLFVPSKSGVDTATQVDVDELFDFDAEVEPILEVLVGKTLEHAMMEVLEEEELSNIRAHQERFEQERNVERAQVQRLEAEAVRRNEERKRRVAQEEERKKREAIVLDKVAARAFAGDYLDDLHETVFDKLVKQGTFYDPLTKEVEEAFLPWLIAAVQQSTDKRVVSRQLADDLLRLTLQKAQHKLQQRKMAQINNTAAAAEAQRMADEESRLRLEAAGQAEGAQPQEAAEE
jgi:hypothetical protein